MALFNLKLKNRRRTVNRAGGEAFEQTPEMALASMLITSFAQDQFYRSANQTFADLKQLLEKVAPEFAAKAAVYARTEMGMRSITHVLAAELAAHASGQPWAKAFYKHIVKRPDDMLEIMAYFYAHGNKSLPNAMKKGFAAAFDKFDGYQLAKYRGESKSVKLVDLVNLVHPTPTDKNAKALRSLMLGELKSTQTWEAKLTQAGQKAASKADKAERKSKAWADLIRSNRLGYFALLRNLRNIAEQAPHLMDEVCRQLTDRSRIKRSLVLPFRFLTALDAINESDVKAKRKITDALNVALELSLDNVPRFKGRTLVVLDDSGSMTGGRKQMDRSPIQIGSLFAAMLYKLNDADLMRFSDHASFVSPFHRDAAMTIANGLVKNARAAGTNFHSIFENAKLAYDRIIILSDMQGWKGYYAPTKAFAEYKRRTGANPYIYSFDLQGYGSLQFPENRVFCLAGMSEKVFDIMKLLERDRRGLVSKIKAIELV